jgi:translation initiation factor 2 subunit 3
MATMLSGAAIMDGALLVIAADETCPQPQTREHLAAAEIVGVKNLVVVQNKIDLVDERRALESYKEIVDFVKGSVGEGAPIVPVSAQHNVNIDVLIQTMEKYIPTPKRDPNLPPIMFVVRSFDINKPGTSVEDLEGGVLGGSILQGKFQEGDEIEIRPGGGVQKGEKMTYEPLFTEVVTLQAGGKKVKSAQCGGLVGIGTQLDPSLTKADGLTGNLAGKPGQLPPTLTEATLETFFLERAVGTKELVQVEKLQVRETFLLDVGTSITSGMVNSIKGNTITFGLGRPVCAQEGSRVAISRKIAGRWRLIGYGIII